MSGGLGEEEANSRFGNYGIDIKKKITRSHPFPERL